MPLLIDLQANWREYRDHAFLGALIGTFGGGLIVGAKVLGLLT